MVLASSLAAQGSVAAVADGTANAATAAPPAADAANTAERLRRNVLAVQIMENSLRFANALDTSANTVHSDNRVPRPKRLVAHSASDIADAADRGRQPAG